MCAAKTLFSNIKGLTAVVTGASSGLGLGCTERLLSRGANVLALDLKKTAELPKGCTFMTCDVTKEADVMKAVEAVKDKLGPVQLLVNSAGIALSKPLYDFESDKPHSAEELDRVLKVNVFGALNVTRLMVPEMVKGPADADGQRGLILNFASIAGHEGRQLMVVYSATKAACAGMCLPLAREFAPKGIRVVTIAPGYFDTPMLHALPGYTYDQLVPHIPLPSRFGKMDELADMMEFIMQNPMVNGTTIYIDGAHRMPYQV